MASHSHSHSMGFYPPMGGVYGAPLLDDDARAMQLQHAAASPQSTSSAGAWSPNAGVDTDSSSVASPPASDDGCLPTYPHHQHASAGREEWDFLSEMLGHDAAAQSFFPPASATSGAYASFGAPPKFSSMPQPMFHQQFHPPQTHFPQAQLQRRPPAAVTTSGFMDALLMQEDDVLPAKSLAVGSPQTTDLFPAMPALPSASSSCASESDSSPVHSPLATQTKARKTSSTPAPRSRSTAASPSSPPLKQENLSAEELKKMRRRSQIASSVQRHREKKKCLVASLKQDLSSLTAQLETLRSQRKMLHANNERLVEWEEEAITQRRKRKQSEELNQRMKKALFQQTCFLMGMRSIMTNLPAPREMQIHDWLHSYTVLSARDQGARQKEYLAYFSDSKVDMAYQIVMRETDQYMSRLTLSSPYFAEIRVLHDGTDELVNEDDMVLKRELTEVEEFVVPGTGQVAKKYTSMFLFEERGNCTIEAFKHVALEATKAVGVFWPSPGYTAKALEMVQVQDGSQMIFSGLHGSMSLIDDQLTSEDQDVQLEARMLCRIRSTDNDSIIAWDYADKDELYPIEGERSIRRDSCGAVLVRREPGGMISFRCVCVKMFGPLDTQETVSNDAKALTQRRINLQVSDNERANQKCVRSVYESLTDAFRQSVSIAH